MSRTRSLLVACTLALPLAALESPLATATPRVIAHAPAFHALAAAGTIAAWAQGDSAGCIDVHVLDLVSQRTAKQSCVAGDTQQVDFGQLSADSRRVAFTTTDQTGNEKETDVDSFGLTRLARLSGFAVVGRDDGVGDEYAGVAGASSVTAALITGSTLKPAGCSVVDPGCDLVSDRAVVQIGTRRKVRSVTIGTDAVDITVGDDAAWVTSTRAGVLHRVTPGGLVSTIRLVPAPPAAATVLEAAGRIVAVSPHRVAVYSARTGARVRTLPVVGGAGAIALRGRLLVSRGGASLHVLDVASGRDVVILRDRRVTTLFEVAANRLGVLFATHGASGGAIVLVPWSDAPAALARLGRRG